MTRVGSATPIEDLLAVADLALEHPELHPHEIADALEIPRKGVAIILRCLRDIPEPAWLIREVILEDGMTVASLETWAREARKRRRRPDAPCFACESPDHIEVQCPGRGLLACRGCGAPAVAHSLLADPCQRDSGQGSGVVGSTSLRLAGPRLPEPARLIDAPEVEHRAKAGTRVAKAGTHAA